MADNEEKYEASDVASSTSAVDQASIDEAWARATNNRQTDKVSVQDLLDKAGVTSEDFQAVCDQHPELIQHIGGGATCGVLGTVATTVKNEYTTDKNGKKKVKAGRCHSGVIEIHRKANNIVERGKNPDTKGAMTDSLFTQEAKQAGETYRKERPYQGGSNGGCSEVAMFKASDDYVTVAVPNKAYGKYKGCKESQELNSLFYGVQPGVTITVDSIEDNAMRKRQGNTNGGKWGHCAVKRKDGRFACDFVQTSIDFSRYGEYAHACFPKDASVPKEYAQMLIEQAQKRMGGIEQTQIVENTQTKVNEQMQTPVSQNEQTTTQSARVSSVSLKDLLKQKGELAENKDGREGATVAIKGGKVDGNVDFRDAKKGLDKKDERTAKEAIREDNQILNTVSNGVTANEPVSSQQTNGQRAQSQIGGIRFERITPDDAIYQKLKALQDEKNSKNNVQQSQNNGKPSQNDEQKSQSNKKEPKKVRTMTVAEIQAYLNKRRQSRP